MVEAEYFGYRDSASQPVLGGAGADARVGEFVLGYPDAEEGGDGARRPPLGAPRELSRLPPAPPGRGGLPRDARAGGGGGGLTAEQLGAKLIGRWPSGATLAVLLPSRDPGIRDDTPPPITRADFESDPDGTRTPLFAHIRKAHPRVLDAATPGRHRLLRRGIPYGPPLPAGAASDDGR